jgi:hypothetical protein
MTFGAWEWTHVAVGGAASAIFLFQTLGNAHFGADTGADGAEFDADSPAGYEGGVSISDYLSVRNFVAFFIGYGWVTLACLVSGSSRIASSFWGIAAGVSLVVVSLFLIKTFLKFQEDGSIKFESLVGEMASVYITIGASMSSQGKVLVDTREGRVELPARTKDARPLRPGQMVRIQDADVGVLWVTEESEAKNAGG